MPVRYGCNQLRPYEVKGLEGRPGHAIGSHLCLKISTGFKHCLKIEALFERILSPSLCWLCTVQRSAAWGLLTLCMFSKYHLQARKEFQHALKVRYLSKVIFWIKGLCWWMRNHWKIVQELLFSWFPCFFISFLRFYINFVVTEIYFSDFLLVSRTWTSILGEAIVL